MRRAALLFTACFLLGLLLIFGSIVASVLAGAIPYPDGPNAGHISGPGLGRWIEQNIDDVALSGVCGVLVGLLGLTVVFCFWKRRRGIAATHTPNS